MTQFLAFTLEQAARLSDLTERRLRYWDQTGFFSPSYRDEPRRPFGRVYSFRDVVGLRTLAMLRRDFGIPLQTLRRVGEWLHQHYDAPWSELRFFVAGKEVYFHDATIGLPRHGRNPAQTVIAVEMKEVAASTEADAARLRERTPEEIGQIVQNRHVSHNAPVLAGTRIRTEAIWHFHESGHPLDEILHQYPRLTPQDVEAAIAYERQRRQLAVS